MKSAVITTFLTGALFATATLASSAWNKSPQNIRKLYDQLRGETFTKPVERISESTSRITPKKFQYLNRHTKQFWVNGSAGAIPDVNFDISESYAGLLPISEDKNESRKLYFWFFPTTGGPETKDDLVIWLNGGPGCSSLEGLLQENGPFTWQYGTFLPVQNKYTWVNLTNMIWIEQPVGTGFTQGEPNIRNEEELAVQFLGFLKNFVNTFGLHGKRIWITGESYAGKYIPYIADAMYAKKDKRNFNIKGTMLYDPSIDEDLYLEEAPAVPFLIRNNAIFNLPDSKVAELKDKADTCGYTDIYTKGLTFPPQGPLNATAHQSCDLWNEIFNEALKINPCFNLYHIMTTCPNLWDVLGFPGSFGYLPAGAKIYFTRPEVQKAINAPLLPTWEECSAQDVFPKGDSSPFPAPSGVLARVIEKSERTVIAHGLLDFILIADGTLISLNNMVWGGARGFSRKPSGKFVVPYENQGELGTWHEERGLTYIEVKMAGHMVPQYQPGAGYRHLEYLLGRVKDLSQ
ncbi:hypothetical protein H072_11104 [Dactylellina haptotyla CBS 200.50]|uniref:Carboxypeptidase n=1 Tax=Dactylellina haptotyla (strain CBS 200.50) TaxID=1284197 RepID=S8BJR1_DACHA|nr:hypothetical protein H072_11104 [Dactylellina haptotyla CBS 200.50]